MHGEKAPGISENMISYMLIDRDDICQDGPFKNAPSIISKANDHNRIFKTAQRFGMPVLSGTAVITVEEADIP